MIKVGTKAVIKHLLDGEHPLDCKLDGYGDILIKPNKVKKA